MKEIRKKTSSLPLLALATLLFIACKDSDDSIRPNSKDGIAIDKTVTLTFDNIVGDQELVLTAPSYGNQSGENYEITELKYIISAITLIQSDGMTFNYPIDESFFVIDENDPTSLQVNLTDIPTGRYKTLKFGFGIDQSRYPITQGTLNFVPKAEEKGMLWAWAAGYKFLKMEGVFRVPGSDVSESFTYHIGSLSNTLDNYKEIALALPTSTNDEITTDVTITADIAKIFDAANTITISEKPDIQIDPENSPKIAENINAMFDIK